MQDSGESREQVVGVEGLAGDVAARAFVRDGPSHESRSGVKADQEVCVTSHQNFSSSDLADSLRYSADPRWSLIGMSVRSSAACARSTAAMFHKRPMTASSAAMARSGVGETPPNANRACFTW